MPDLRTLRREPWRRKVNQNAYTSAAFSPPRFASRSFPPSPRRRSAAPSFETLRRQFLSPPDAAKPMVRWWWFGAAVVKPEILRELQQMKADGIGGAELAFEYPMTLDDPAKNLKNLPFLSPEMLDDVAYAQAEGRKLGLADRPHAGQRMALWRPQHAAVGGLQQAAHRRGSGGRAGDDDCGPPHWPRAKR
jgi:hypothetical protein